MKREYVEALLRKAENPITGYQTKMTIDPSDLAALCRRWLAVEDAPVVCFWSGDHDGEFTTDSPEQADAIQTGQRVRIVPEQGEG